MRKTWRSLAALLAMALILAATGCATQSQPMDQGQPEAGGAQGGAADKAPAPAPDQPSQPSSPVRLVIGAHQDIQHWDIHNHNFTFTEAVHQNVFDYLVRMNAETGEFAPDLAVSWQVVEPTVWEFKLRQGVTFHNGDPFTAEDVKFTVERVATDDTLKEYRTMKTVKEVQVVDPYTVRIVTHEPDSVLLNRLSRIGSGIMPAGYWQKVGLEGWQKAPVGTGPFRFEEWVKDDHITLKAFPEHWRGRPAIDEVVYRILPETATRVAELQSGGVDIALNIGVDNVELIKKVPGLDVTSGLTNRVWLLLVRTQPEYATGNPQVRAAIEQAIDRQGLIDAVSPGLGVPTRTRATPGITGADPSLYNAGQYDPDRARALLAAAGYGGGLKLGLLSRSSSDYSLVAQTIAGMLEKVGIQVDLDMVDTAAYNNKLSAAGNPELYLAAFGNSMKDAEVAFDFVVAKDYMERLGYGPQDVVDLYQATRSEMDSGRRAEMFRELQQRVAEDRPQIMLFQMGSVHGVRQGVQWQPTQDEMLWVYDIKVSR